MDAEDQFLYWTKQWEKAVEDGIFSQEDIKTGKKTKQDFFGQLDINQNSEPADDKDASYWNDINNYEESFDLLTEAKDDKKNLVKKVKKISHNNNAVDYKTLGQDSKNSPAKWGSGEDFEKLIELKQKLHDLNVSLTSKETLGEKVDQIKSEIDKLLSNIEDVNDEMGGSRFKSDPE